MLTANLTYGSITNYQPDIPVGLNMSTTHASIQLNENVKSWNFL